LTDYRGRLFKEDKAIALPFKFMDSSEKPRHLKIAAVVHIYYEDLSYEILSYMHNLPVGSDLFITTDNPRKLDVIKSVFSAYKLGKVQYAIVVNRGRDVAAKLVGMKHVYQEYDFVLNLHSKRSLHSSDIVAWRTYLYETLCGSREIVHDALTIFSIFPNIGLIFPQHFELIRQWVSWTGNFDMAASLAAKMGGILNPDQAIDFPSGSMFWIRTAAIKPLLELDLTVEDFEEERGQADNTLAHVIERLMAIVCEIAGFDWVKIGRREFFNHDELVLEIADLAGLKEFVSTQTIQLTGEKIINCMYDCNSKIYPPPSALKASVSRNEKMMAYGKEFTSWTKIGDIAIP